MFRSESILSHSCKDVTLLFYKKEEKIMGRTVGSSMDWQIFQLAFACYFQEQMLQLKIMMIIQMCDCTAGIIIFEREALYKWQMVRQWLINAGCERIFMVNNVDP